MFACRDKTFDATKICFSRQNVCRDKHTFLATKDVFVATKKMILVAAPANDSQRLSAGSFADGYLTIHWRCVQVHPLINKTDFEHPPYRSPPSLRALRNIFVADNVLVYIYIPMSLLGPECTPPRPLNVLVNWRAPPPPPSPSY